MIQSRINTHNKRHNKAVAMLDLWLREIPLDRQFLGTIIAEWSIHERRAIMAGRQSRRDARTFAQVAK